MLLHANTALKTRVSELEVINGLFKGTVDQLEAGLQAKALHGDSDDQLRQLLEQSLQREADLKRRIDDLERQVRDLQQSEPPAKRQRISDRSD